MKKDALFSSLFYRRIYDRFPLAGRASVDTRFARGISSLVTDISSRGASIVTTVPFERNEQLQVSLDPCWLFSSTIRRQARVVWCAQIKDTLWQAGLDFGSSNPINFS